MSKKLERLTLPDSEIKDLQTQYKQERDRRIAERILCIILYAQDHHLKEIKRILLVSITHFQLNIKLASDMRQPARE
jgi:hypothetical protein